jgi:hypothetical protein
LSGSTKKVEKQKGTTKPTNNQTCEASGVEYQWSEVPEMFEKGEENTKPPNSQTCEASGIERKWQKGKNSERKQQSTTWSKWKRAPKIGSGKFSKRERKHQTNQQLVIGSREKTLNKPTINHVQPGRIERKH